MLFLRSTASAHAILRALTSRKAQCLVFVAFLCCWVNSERIHGLGSTWCGLGFLDKKTGKIKNKGREMVTRESSRRLSWNPRLGRGNGPTKDMFLVEIKLKYDASPFIIFWMVVIGWSGVGLLLCWPGLKCLWGACRSCAPSNGRQFRSNVNPRQQFRSAFYVWV